METKIKLKPNEQVDIAFLPPLALAYLGDAVYELMVRTMLVNKGLVRVDSLHREAVELVRAGAQSQLLHDITDWLTEEELKVMKRGRNAKSGHIPKNAGAVEYRQSTGLESLVGYWYLKGEEDRLDNFFCKLVEFYANQGEE